MHRSGQADRRVGNAELPYSVLRWRYKIIPPTMRNRHYSRRMAVWTARRDGRRTSWTHQGR